MALERSELYVRIRNLAVLAGGLTALGAVVAAGRYASTTAQTARETLSIAGWGPENSVPLRLAVINGRPRFTATVVTNDATVKLAYVAAMQAWLPVSAATLDGTPIALSDYALAAHITSRQRLEDVMREHQPAF